VDAGWAVKSTPPLNFQNFSTDKQTVCPCFPSARVRLCTAEDSQIVALPK
jgi:hypothetical protein